MNTQPVILLNIAETIPVLEGLVLYALADGNEGARKVDDFESCMKFYVVTTNTLTGERVKMKFALHGRLVSRKGVGIDHDFVLQSFITTLKDHLAAKSLIITGDLEPGVQVTRAIWRYVFGAGTRASNFANGVGIFSQPAETNFNIGEDDVSKLKANVGAYTLAIANSKMVKFYLGEEPPVWGTDKYPDGSTDENLWWPCKKKVTPNIIDDCLDHFVKYISPENEVLQVFVADKFDDLEKFVHDQLTPKLEEVGHAPIRVPVEAVAEQVKPTEDASLEKPTVFERIRSFVGIETPNASGR